MIAPHPRLKVNVAEQLTVRLSPPRTRYPPNRFGEIESRS
jgi:hypothetical protein